MSNTAEAWLVSKHATPDYAPQFGVYSETHPNDFAIVRGEDKARMIQAVPDMIAALESVVENMEGDISLILDHEVDCPGPDECCLCKARAALRKVRGE